MVYVPHFTHALKKKCKRLGGKGSRDGVYYRQSITITITLPSITITIIFQIFKSITITINLQSITSITFYYISGDSYI